MSNKPIDPARNPSGKSHFQDSTRPSMREDGAYPFEFKAPTYDNRTSCSISAGNNYGVGFRTPTGLFHPRDIKQGPIEQKAKCFSPYDVFESQDMRG